MNKLSVEALLSTLPDALRENRQAYAIAQIFASALAHFVDSLDALRIYPRIEELPEELLDLLAYDCKIDWWDADYSLDEKRRTLAGSWRVHRTLGTKSAVEEAISAIYPGTQVQEWYEYGGDPYHFKLLIDSTDALMGTQKYQRVVDRVSFYKNLRSVLDEVEYFDAGGTAEHYFASMAGGIELIDSASAE